jgi:hypothetical protein
MRYSRVKWNITKLKSEKARKLALIQKTKKTVPDTKSYINSNTYRHRQWEWDNQNTQIISRNRY